VLSVGDEEFSAKCIAKIQEMKYRGVTLIFVTHQLEQVRNLCDRALWLDHGEMEAVGDPMRVVDHYLQEVSGTVGAPASPPAGPAPSSAPGKGKGRTAAGTPPGQPARTPALLPCTPRRTPASWR